MSASAAVDDSAIDRRAVLRPARLGRRSADLDHRCRQRRRSLTPEARPPSRSGRSTPSSRHRAPSACPRSRNPLTPLSSPRNPAHAAGVDSVPMPGPSLPMNLTNLAVRKRTPVSRLPGGTPDRPATRPPTHSSGPRSTPPSPFVWLASPSCSVSSVDAASRASSGTEACSSTAAPPDAWIWTTAYHLAGQPDVGVTTVDMSSN